jgi:hypothetical protein
MRLRVNFQLLQIRIHHFLAAVGALPQHTELISFISLDPPCSIVRYIRPLAAFLVHTLPHPLSCWEYTIYSFNLGRATNLCSAEPATHLRTQGISWSSQKHTILVGFGALTGNPFALTGALVPSLSPLRCSRWIYSFPLVSHLFSFSAIVGGA